MGGHSCVLILIAAPIDACLMSQQTSGTKNVQCKYYLHGACNKGDSCHFSHEMGSSKPNMVCRFYQQGHCAYGDNCRYDHVKPAQPVTQPVPPAPAVARSREAGVSRLHGWSSQPEPAPQQSWQDESWEEEEQQPTSGRNANELLCPFAARGSCQRGPSCPYLHGNVCPGCGKQCLHPTDFQAQEKHFLECGASKKRRNFKAQQALVQNELSRGVECGICLEEVTSEARPPTDRRFGLLEGCNHAFCLDCIRNWRSGGSANTEVVRSCPICRAVSYFVVPSTVWVEEADKKTHLIETYKQGMGQKPCKHFNFGEGECPFGSSCFYSHRYRDGMESEVQNLRHVAGEDSTKIVDSIRLWDFLEANNSTQRHN